MPNNAVTICEKGEPGSPLSAGKMNFTDPITLLAVEVRIYKVGISTKFQGKTHLKGIDGENTVVRPAAVIVHFSESPKVKDKDSVGLQRE